MPRKKIEESFLTGFSVAEEEVLARLGTARLREECVIETAERRATSNILFSNVFGVISHR